MPIILASSSTIRHQLLAKAGVEATAVAARLDEDTVTAGLRAEGASPRDIADALAEMKAQKVAQRFPADWVIGCDQVLEVKGELLTKSATRQAAEEVLRQLKGTTHKLLSAVVVYHEGQPVWRHIAEARLTMRPISDEYLEEYLARNWPSVQDSVGAYKLEEEGGRLFSAVSGDYFTVLGLPLLPLLGYLGDRGVIAK